MASKAKGTTQKASKATKAKAPKAKTSQTNGKVPDSNATAVTATGVLPAPDALSEVMQGTLDAYMSGIADDMPSAEEIKALFDHINAKSKDEKQTLTPDEAVFLIRQKAEKDRTATDNLRLVEWDAKRAIRAARKAVKVETKTLATAGTEKLIASYVKDGVNIGAPEDGEEPVIIDSMIAAVEAMNTGRKVNRLTIRYVVNEAGKAETKISFKLTKVETPKDAVKAA